MKKFIKRALQSKGEGLAGLSVILVNDRKMRNLNRMYLNRSYPTDVLAFSSREGGGLSPENWLGDIVISTEMAASQAKGLNTSIDREIHLYLAHGILHLLGYKDISAGEKREIRREEAKIMKGYYER
ncbi:MAG: rRNA maturation RNase YbeY [Candidatus Omnitrophica bacterium]|nr:rRNA maturation RNase YbeY [Candidatus Omnitrophota bacterium]